jgi:hypothetical protein
MTMGGATNVLMLRNTLNVRTMMPSRFNRLASVIFTAFADFTRKITDILRTSQVSFLFGFILFVWIVENPWTLGLIKELADFHDSIIPERVYESMLNGKQIRHRKFDM